MNHIYGQMNCLLRLTHSAQGFCYAAFAFIYSFVLIEIQVSSWLLAWADETSQWSASCFCPLMSYLVWCSLVFRGTCQYWYPIIKALLVDYHQAELALDSQECQAQAQSSLAPAPLHESLLLLLLLELAAPQQWREGRKIFFINFTFISGLEILLTFSEWVCVEGPVSPPAMFFLFFLANSVVVLFFLFFASFPSLSYSCARWGFFRKPPPHCSRQGVTILLHQPLEVSVRADLIGPQLAQTLLPVALDTHPWCLFTSHWPATQTHHLVLDTLSTWVILLLTKIFLLA